MFNNIIPAFIVGGLICVIGQLVMDLTKANVTPSHILVGYVTGGVILGALGLYKPLIEMGGAGASIPLSGFGYNLAKGAIEGTQKEGMLGAFSGGVEAAAVGIAAAIIFSFFISLMFNPKG